MDRIDAPASSSCSTTLQREVRRSQTTNRKTDRVVVMLDPAGHPFCLFPGETDTQRADGESR